MSASENDPQGAGGAAERAASATAAPGAGAVAGGMGVLADVLCGVDGTRSAYEAVQQAAALAGSGGHLTIVAATALSGSGDAGGYHLQAAEPSHAGLVLEEAQRLAGEAGVRSDVELEPEGSPADALLERAAGHGLLALGAPSMSRLAHLLIGGVATKAAHALPCALLVARPAPAGTRFDERIMVASDALERSDELVDFAAELARSHRASLVLFHAPGAESAAHPTRIAAQAERVRAAAGEASTVRVEPGRAHRAIVRAAVAERVSLIVLASRRTSGLRALGSVSERVVHDAPCSVLVLRPDDL